MLILLCKLNNRIIVFNKKIMDKKLALYNILVILYKYDVKKITKLCQNDGRVYNILLTFKGLVGIILYG